MAQGRSRSSDLAARPAARSGRGRGFVTMTQPLPRFVRVKKLASGVVGFYWELTGYYRKLGCSIPGEPLGSDYTAACGQDGNGGQAAVLNRLFDEWRAGRKGEPIAGLIK